MNKHELIKNIMQAIVKRTGKNVKPETFLDLLTLSDKQLEKIYNKIK